MAMKWIQGGFNAKLPATVLSDTEALATPGAGQAHYITDITLHGGSSVAGAWTIKSGSTVLFTIWTALNETKNIFFKVPIKCDANANINVTHPASTASNGIICGFTDRG